MQWFFTKAAASPPPALPVPQEPTVTPQDKDIALAQKELSFARYGSACRTSTFTNEREQREWRTAHQEPVGRTWSILKITESKDPASGEIIQKYLKLKADVSFLDALKDLSAYEQGQIALGLLREDAPENPDEMHYASFAERERVIFDINGAPHPTLYGRIITDGTFSTAAIERARAYDPERSHYRISSQTNFSRMFVVPPIDVSAGLETVLDKSVQVTKINKALNVIEVLHIFTSLVFEIASTHPKGPRICSWEADTVFNSLTESTDEEKEAILINKIQSSNYSIKDIKKEYGPKWAFYFLGKERYYKYDQVDRIHKVFSTEAIKLVSEIHSEESKDPTATSGEVARKIRARIDLTIACFDIFRLCGETLDLPFDKLSLDDSKRIFDETKECEKTLLKLCTSQEDLWMVRSAILGQSEIVYPDILGPCITALTTIRDQYQRDVMEARSRPVPRPVITHGNPF